MFSRIADYREEIVNWVLMEIATGQRTCLQLSGKQLIESQPVVKDLRMSRARDEVHNSEVEECNLVSSPAGVVFESRFPRVQTRRSIASTRVSVKARATESTATAFDLRQRTVLNVSSSPRTRFKLSRHRKNDRLHVTVAR